MGKKVLIFLICVFLIAFPKGGIKVGDTPITFGYILLMLYTFFSLIIIINENSNRNNVYVKRGRQHVLLCCLPFQIYSSIILMLSENTVSFGFVLSFVLSVILMPLIFLFFFNKYIDRNYFEGVFNPVFKNSIRFVSIFGIIVFFIKIRTGKEIEIPFLTVNIDDVGTLAGKYNSRGTISKLISTYNNGNIYGISLIILLPLYLEREKFLIFKGLLILSLILTLSRTVWAGLLIFMIVYFITKLNSVKGWIVILGSLIFIVVAGPIILNAMGVNLDFLFDKTLGGRAQSLNVLNDISMFGSLIYKGVSEIVYVSILDTFGFLGLLFFIIYLLSPVVIYLNTRRKDRNFNKSEAFWGLWLYWLLCLSDGAMLFIPVMAFYWFLASYIFRDRQPALEPAYS